MRNILNKTCRDITLTLNPSSLPIKYSKQQVFQKKLIILDHLTTNIQHFS